MKSFSLMIIMMIQSSVYSGITKIPKIRTISKGPKVSKNPKVLKMSKSPKDLKISKALSLSPSTIPSVNPSDFPTTFPSVSMVPTALTWIQMGLDIDGEAARDQSGESVSISSDGLKVAIGADENDGNGVSSGHVRVYRYESDPDQWIQMGQDIDGEMAGDESGASVSLSSDGLKVAIGSMFNDGNGGSSGHVRVYRYESDPDQWIQMGQDIDGEMAGDESGQYVSLSSDGLKVAIGAEKNDGNGDRSGHVRVFRYESDPDQWIQMGQDIDGESAGDHSGDVSLSSNGLIVAIGANGNHGNGISYSGHVRVYRYESDPDQWIQMGQDIDGEAYSDWSGESVSLSFDGLTVAIGAHGNSGNGFTSGHVRVYQYKSDRDQWIQIGQDVDGEASCDYSGRSVSLSSDGLKMAIGAAYNDGNGFRSGHVRVYQYKSGRDQWIQIGSDIDGEAAGDQSGSARSGNSVSLSSDGLRVAIGAHLNDGNGNRSGHVRVFKLESN